MTNTATTTGHDTFCDCQACVDAQVATIHALPNNAGPVTLDDFDDQQDDDPASAPCLRCGRRLTDPKAIARGYGRTCARRIHDAELAAVDLVKPSQLADAVELVETGSVVPVAGHRFLTLASDGVTRYETDPYSQTCTCTAGQYGRRCKHIVAAALIAA